MKTAIDHRRQKKFAKKKKKTAKYLYSLRPPFAVWGREIRAPLWFEVEEGKWKMLILKRLRN